MKDNHRYDWNTVAFASPPSLIKVSPLSKKGGPRGDLHGKKCRSPFDTPLGKGGMGFLFQRSGHPSASPFVKGGRGDFSSFPCSRVGTHMPELLRPLQVPDMIRSRYRVHAPSHPRVLTCTVVNRITLFNDRGSVQRLPDSWSFSRSHTEPWE